MKIFGVLKTVTRIKTFFFIHRCFALNHDKSLQIYFFCVKRQAKIDFLKDVGSAVNSCSL